MARKNCRIRCMPQCAGARTRTHRRLLRNQRSQLHKSSAITVRVRLFAEDSFVIHSMFCNICSQLQQCAVHSTQCAVGYLRENQHLLLMAREMCMKRFILWHFLPKRIVINPIVCWLLRNFTIRRKLRLVVYFVSILSYSRSDWPRASCELVGKTRLSRGQLFSKKEEHSLCIWHVDIAGQMCGYT